MECLPAPSDRTPSVLPPRSGLPYLPLTGTGRAHLSSERRSRRTRLVTTPPQHSATSRPRDLATSRLQQSTPRHPTVPTSLRRPSPPSRRSLRSLQIGCAPGRRTIYGRPVHTSWPPSITDAHSLGPCRTHPNGMNKNNSKTCVR